MKKYQTSVVILLVLATSVLSILHLDIRPIELFEGVSNISILLEDAFPPDMSVLGIAWEALIETIEIAFLGTVIGAILSFPLAILASRNIFTPVVVRPVRVLLAAIRSLPALLWAVVFVVLVGLGSFAGILATALYTVGYLAKLQYEAMEGIRLDSLEAVQAIGASKIQLIRFVVFPEAANHLISQLLFMFEYNVRASSILGFVGAGGMGFYILGYLRFLKYDSVVTLLAVIFITVLILDALSQRLRDTYLNTNRHTTA